MNASATDLINKLGINGVTNNSTISELVSKLHRGGSRRRNRRKRNKSQKNRSRKNRSVNKKYTWPFW